MNTLISPLEFFDDLFLSHFEHREKRSSPTRDIPIDVFENDLEYRVVAELPGAKREQLIISIDANFVLIATEDLRNRGAADAEAWTLIKETSPCSRARRGFSLACVIDEAAVTVQLEDGVLMLVLPKRRRCRKPVSPTGNEASTDRAHKLPVVDEPLVCVPSCC